MPFLHDAWYVAAWADDLKDMPIRRRILNEPVAMYRRTSGTVVAIGDLCPHRFASLGNGKIIDDTLQCPYHGLQFDASGACVFNPHGDGKIPSAAKVKAYSVVERDGTVWIWMGDPATAEPSLIPDFGVFSNPDLAVGRGYLAINAYYELVTDNLLDLSHTEYLHPLLNNPGGASRARSEMKQEGTTVWARMWQDAEAVTPLFRMLWESPSSKGDLWAHMRWTAPSSLDLDVGITEMGADPTDGVLLPSAHLLTPETETTTHYFWAIGRNRFQDNSEVGETIRSAVAHAFATEDEPMISQVYENMGREALLALRPVLMPGDAAAMRARRVLADLLQREAARVQVTNGQPLSAVHA